MSGIPEVSALTEDEQWKTIFLVTIPRELVG